VTQKQECKLSPIVINFWTYSEQNESQLATQETRRSTKNNLLLSIYGLCPSFDEARPYC